MRLPTTLSVILPVLIFTAAILGAILKGNAAYDAFKRLLDRLKLLRCRKLYGNHRDFALVYSELFLSYRIVPEELRRRPFVKPHITDTFSLHRMACVCEIRAASYITGSLTNLGRRVLNPESDVEWKGSATQSAILLGTTSNRWSMQLLDLAGWIRYDKIRRRFVSRRSGRCLHDLHSQSVDYGAIVRIFPRPDEKVMWTMCGGTREHGTSGCAWYLSHRLDELCQEIRQKNQPFVCIVIVKQENDTLAKAIFLAQTEADLESHAISDCPGTDDISSCPHDCKQRIDELYSATEKKAKAP